VFRKQRGVPQRICSRCCSSPHPVVVRVGVSDQAAAKVTDDLVLPTPAVGGCFAPVVASKGLQPPELSVGPWCPRCPRGLSDATSPSGDGGESRFTVSCCKARGWLFLQPCPGSLAPGPACRASGRFCSFPLIRQRLAPRAAICPAAASPRAESLCLLPRLNPPCPRPR